MCVFVIIKTQGVEMTNRNLLAIPVGIKQKGNVDALVKKVLQFFIFFLHELILNPRHCEEERFPLDVKLLCLSFFQRILRLFFSITMEIWINGGILSGLLKPYILLHRTRLNGSYLSFSLSILLQLGYH